ncbi:DNA modification methylase [Deinococcus saxicola]|uniref:DNA methyltransferase n=1 Tax=Deinococcus saxicola TaxID=249406 RepID=UPI0039F00D95
MNPSVVPHRHVTLPIDDIQPHPRNVNVGDVEAIRLSIRENGYYPRVLVQESRRFILVGNHTWQGAKEEGFSELQVTLLDVDDRAALKILLADNRTAELSHRDEEALAQLLQELAADDPAGLSGTGYDAGDLDTLLAGLAGDTPAEDDGDDTPTRLAELEATQAKWNVQPGDLWLIESASRPGEHHRILCADGTDPANLDHLIGKASIDLVHCDPPYGIKIVKKDGMIGSSDGYLPVQGDDSTDVAARAYALTVRRYPKAVQVWWGGNYYADQLPPSMGWLVWDKQNDGMSFADVELAWTNKHRAARMFRHLWSGGARASETDERRIHPTQKPIALGVWVLELLAQSGANVLDLCLGSGMTLLAAEQHGSTCYATEIEVRYVAAVLERAERRGLSCTRSEHLQRAG